MQIEIVPAPRPEREEDFTFIRPQFEECPVCRKKVGAIELCVECLERRELWGLAEKHKLLPHQRRGKK